MIKYDLTRTVSLLFILFLSACNSDSYKEQDYIEIPNSQEDLSAYYENQSDTTLFRLVSPAESGITFYNEVHETEENTFWKYKFIYSGSGIGAGDFNRDGLIDLFFVSNTKANALYLNKGNLKFEDISETAGIQDSMGFSYGVAVADFNQDGWPDIYVSKAGGIHMEEPGRRNRLFINNHDLTFTEKAAEYGLDHPSNSTQASMLDYDLDGDLDFYLTTHWLSDKQINSLKSLAHIEKGTNYTDYFFRNDQNGKFAEVSRETGINNNGMGWSGTVGDYDNDGWPDIYVANDFIMYNFLYMNNQQGSFRQAAFESLKKMTRFGMGSDAGDINNDGYLDIVVAGIDMQDHVHQKSMLNFDNTEAFEGRLASGFHYQKPRNTLQINNGDGTFSEIGCYAGVSTTNWTWATIFEDFDNDGWNDLFVANGFFIPWYMDNRFSLYGKLRQAVKTGNKQKYFKLRHSMYRDHHKYPNEIYKNNKDLTFTRKTFDWGIDLPNVSYGATVVDLDNDGDMDILATDTNNPPTFYENRSRQLLGNRFLKFICNGPPANPYAFNTKIYLYDEKDQLIQYKYVQPIKGYLSTSDHRVNFGVGQREIIPKVVIVWPDGKQTTMTKVATDQTLTIKHEDAVDGNHQILPKRIALFEPAPKGTLEYEQQENPFDDFDRQFNLHAKQSNHGPSIAVADVNGDNLEDAYFGGAQNYPASLYLQQADGSFTPSNQSEIATDQGFEDLGSLFFDADNDGDLDLYQCSGGGTYRSDLSAYQDRLYLNDGKGLFQKATDALPEIQSSGSCVIAADYDQDGDLDLFVGGRVVPSFYPTTPRSYLLKNNSGTFEDVTPELLQKPGMVTSALWTDFNNDESIDLILVGDWMQPRFFQNQNGGFSEVTHQTGLTQMEGWWNSITGADFDEDGDIDYVLGNAGMNNYVSTSPDAPLGLVYGDFNKDEQIDLMYTYVQKGNRYPVFGFGAFQKNFPEWQNKVEGFTPYAKMTFPEIQEKFFPGQGEELYASTFENVWLENKGNGQFEKRPLPNSAQLAPINGVITGDFDNDGHIDIVCHGNFYPAHYAFERQDAGTGLFLKGDGQGNFEVYRGKESGFFSDVDARSLVAIDRGGLPTLILAANNSDKARAFFLSQSPRKIDFRPNDRYALVKKVNGKIQKVEHYHGNGYLSQTSSHYLIGSDVLSIELIDQNGEKRTMESLVSFNK